MDRYRTNPWRMRRVLQFDRGHLTLPFPRTPLRSAQFQIAPSRSHARTLRHPNPQLKPPRTSNKKNGWQRLLPAVLVFRSKILIQLPVPTAAVASATAVETTTATMEAAAAVDCPGATAAESTANRSTSDGCATGKTASSSESGPASFKSAARKSTSAEAATAPVASTEPVEPRSSPDEHAAIEPIRSIVAVRRAGIRCVPVISIRASGCSIAAVHGPNSDANSYP